MYVNPHQVCVDPTQVCVNPTQMLKSASAALPPRPPLPPKAPPVKAAAEEEESEEEEEVRVCVCESSALAETATRVRKGNDRKLQQLNCLHHGLQVLNNPVPPPFDLGGQTHGIRTRERAPKDTQPHVERWSTTHPGNKHLHSGPCRVPGLGRRSIQAPQSCCVARGCTYTPIRLQEVLSGCDSQRRLLKSSAFLDGGRAAPHPRRLLRCPCER
jgi:hypothetical protein